MKKGWWCKMNEASTRARLPRLAFAVIAVFLLVNSIENASASTEDAGKQGARTFIIASSDNFPPVNMLDKDGNLTGFGRDLSTAVIRAMGGQTSYIHSPVWSEVLDDLNSSRADFIHDTGYNKERDVYLDFSDPILEMKEVIIVRSDQYDITGFESLKGKTVACVDQHITHLYLMQFPEIKCRIVKTPVEGLYSLIAGDVDAFVYPEQVVAYLSQELRLGDKIKVTGEPLRTLKWSMTVREGDKEMLSLLNEGIRKVRQSGEYDRIYDKWFGKKIFAGYSEKEIWFFGFIAVLLSLAIGISIGLFILNSRLRRSRNELSKALTERERAEYDLSEAEKQYRMLFNSIDEGFCIIEMIFDENEKLIDYRFLDINPSFEKQTGLINAKGKRMRELAPKHEEHWFEIFGKIALTGQPIRFVNRAEQLHRWYDVYAFRFGKPENLQVAILFNDITERKRAEEEIRKNEERLRVAINTVNVAVFNQDTELRYTWMYQPQLGYTTEHVAGKTDAELLPPQDSPKVMALKRHVIESGERILEEIPVHTADKTLIYDLIVEPVKDESGKITGLVGASLDITERKQAEEALRKSEALLNETQRLTKVGGWDYNVQKKKITWTGEVYRIYGVSPDKYDPNDITQDIKFYAPEEQGIIERAFNTAIREGKPYDLQLRFMNANGKHLWVRTIGQGEKKEGRVARVYGYIMDITELKAAEEALHKFAAQLEERVGERTGELAQSQKALMNMLEELNKAMETLHESEKRYRMLVEYSPDGIMVHDTEKFIYANKAALDIFGASEPEELIGKTVLEIIHPDYRETVRKRLQMEKEGKEAHLIEQKFLRMDGTPIDVEIVAFPIKYEDRIEVHSVVRDITERKKAVDAIKAANLRLMELDRMKSMFIASTSHELRTPLNAVIGFSSILLNGWSGELTAEQKEQLQLIHNSGKQLLALINDVIDISKIEAGNIEVYASEFRLKDVVDEAAATLRTSFKEKGLALSVDVPDIIMHTDRRRLLQCILNYLSNAVKFTEKGSIILTAKSINDRIDLSVTDNGIGIREEDIGKLFAPFVRLESSLSAEVGGSGLGLYLTKKLVEETLRGTVAVKSEYGKGSTFSLHIPVKLKVNT